MDKGLFITIEGPDGGGKTTQAGLLTQWMKDRNIPVVLTKEPGTPFIQECLKIRQLLLDPTNDISSRSELFLFLADRAQHVEKFIKPKLDQGINVISDRFSDSTRVYQCARGLSRHKIDMLLDFATDGLVPDLTILLDVPASIGLHRAKLKSGGVGDRMEMESLDFHEEVRNGFLKLSTSLSEGDRFKTIDVFDASIEQVQESIVKYVSQKLWGPK